MSGGLLSAIQMNLRRELAALAEQEEEEENSARSLLALMQKWNLATDVSAESRLFLTLFLF